MAHGRYRRELGEEVYAIRNGVPLYGDMQYEYKDKLDEYDDTYEWERRGEDGNWYEECDGYWKDDDFRDPSKPMLPWNEALKYRTPCSALYDIDLDPDYTPEERQRIKQENEDRQDKMFFEFVTGVFVSLVIMIGIWYLASAFVF